MANTTLFQSVKTRLTAANTRNEAGGMAYTLTPKQQLAQLAATGCLNSTYYTDAQDQLEQVLELAENLDAEFIAKTAVYARQKGFMKDMPALLLAVLAQKDVNMLARVFDQVADNGKILRNFAQIARNGSWQQVRQNLNTFLRHDVFAKSKNIKMVAEKLRDQTAIRRARVLPYQLLTAYQATSEQMPFEIREALQDAMETAVQNVPAIRGKVVVCPDVSGSMHSPATGYRGSATSKTRCIDIAALVSAAMLRTNPQARVIPFEQITVNVQLNPRDSIMTNAEKLANVGGGGTACSAPLAMLNREKADVDLVVIVSDNESWADDSQQWGATTSLMKEWNILKRRCPEAKLVCLDIQPYTKAQARNRQDILNIGGFSDQVFSLIGSFAERGMGTDFWVEEIEKTELAAVN